MKKRFAFYFLMFLILLGSFIYFSSSESVDNLQNTAENLEDVTDAVTDAVDNPKQEFDRVLNNTKAEERIEAINSYIGPITKVLWGYEFSLSWIFIFAFIMWVLLIELIVVPASQLFELNTLGSLGISGVIATLAMQGIGKNLVVYLNSLINVWWAGLFAIGIGVLFGVIYSIGMGALAKRWKMEKEQAEKEALRRAEEMIKLRGKIVEKELKNK